MRLVALDRVPEGATLARDVMSGLASGAPLMRAGIELTPAIAARAGASGVRALWVNDSLGEGITPPEPLVAELCAGSVRVIERTYDAARLAFDRERELDAAVLRALAEIADDLTTEVWAQTPAIVDDAPGDPRGFWHPLRVATLGMSIGAEHLRTHGWLDYTNTPRFDQLDNRLMMLATGLLLHDVGKVALPEKLRNRTHALSAAEQLQFNDHTVVGTKIVPSGFVAPLVRTVIHSHHERWDGTGYPDAKAANEIHPFARIAAVADAFDAITCERPYRRALGRASAVATIEQGAGAQFDPEVVAIFSALVLPYPLGHEVALCDGRHGVVAAVDAGDRLRPLLRLPLPGGGFEEATVDLSEQFAASAAPAVAAAGELPRAHAVLAG